MRKQVKPRKLPKVWAIRMKQWIELRQGVKPQKRTTRAVLQTKRRERFVLATTIYVGGTPFRWLPFHQLHPILLDGEVREVPPEVAKQFLAKEEKKPS